ncbi:MAG TPA: pyruvate kinase [Alphaproteobacteria bacterium]
MSRSEFLPRRRKTRILATLGPASTSPEMIKKLFMAGADNFRLNFSHGTHDDHRARLQIIRDLEQEIGHPIGAIADLQGPKLRVGKFKDGSIDLKPGMKIRFDLDDALGDEERVQLPHPEIVSVADVGHQLLMDDGKVRMTVAEKGKSFLIMEVNDGSKLSNNKGVNVPGVILPIPALTEKDHKDLQAALDMGVDWIAQSFVQRPDDIAEVKKLSGGRAKIIAKLEKPSALDHLDGIIDLTDAVMVARGDLGVEIPPERVPPVQKQIVRKTRMAGKPVIVATQMLESMISAPTPTRAEASDVATAIYDGTDAIMLSAETASGQYPLEAVSIMDRIAQSVESDPAYRGIMDAKHPDTEQDDVSHAVTASAHYIARDIKAAAIATFTMSGGTAQRASRQRPPVPILCLTPDHAVARRLALSYGVHPVYHAENIDFDEMVAAATDYARKENIAVKGSRIVITAGVPFGTPGSTNILRVAWID